MAIAASAGWDPGSVPLSTKERHDRLRPSVSAGVEPNCSSARFVTIALNRTKSGRIGTHNMRVATVDFNSPDAAFRFTRSMHETGFAIIVNHPIPSALVPAIYREWRAFFSTEKKRAYTYTGSRPDGYYPYENGSAASGAFARDRKEFFHVYPWGRCPAEVSDTALRYFNHALALGMTLVSWIDARSPLEVSALFCMPLTRMLTESTGSVLRIQHYLPVTGQEPPDGLRAVAHTDINLLTVLPAPSESGLQVRDAATDSWYDVPCGRGSVVINAGEMLETASGGYFPATEHRVINPPPGSAGSRFSLPLFLQPSDNVNIAPCLTAAEFRQSRVAELARKGWKVVAGGGEPDASDVRGRRVRGRRR